jgi:DNA repair exonuclease SbcCD ATPase subunit
MSQKCPNCKITSIDDKALVCKYCGSDYETENKSDKFEQSNLTSTLTTAATPEKSTKTKSKNSKTPNFVMTPAIENIDNKAVLQQTPTEAGIIETSSLESTHTNQTKSSQPAGNWKLLALTTGFALLGALAIIGFQSFQIQANSNKIKNMEDKAMSQQKSVAELETLSSQNTQLSQDLGETKTELATKTKILDELQSKATSLSDESKAKDDKLTKLEEANKTLTTKNNTLTAQSNTASKELESLKNTPLGKLIQLNK